MATNETQSLNGNLAEGMSDGKYKKVEADRGGVVGIETWEARQHLNDVYFGIHEAKDKVLPDGSTHATPHFVDVPASTNLVYP